MAAGADLGNMNEAWWCPSLVIPGEEYDGKQLNRGDFSIRSLPHSLIVNRRGRRFVPGDRDREQRVGARGHVPAGPLPVGDPLHVGHDHLGQQAPGVRRDEVEVELDQRRASLHLIADAHPRVEPFPFEVHRVDADMQQDVDALGRANRHRMAGGV